MNKDSAVLNQFEVVLYDKARPISEKLQAGLQEAFIDSLLSYTDSSNHQDLKILYSWKNGIQHSNNRPIGQYDFSSVGKMVPLEDAIELYRSAISELNWKKGMIPIFTTYAGDYLLFDANPNSDTVGSIFIYSPAVLIVEPEKIYDDLSAMFRTIIDCFKDGAYIFDPTSLQLEIDYEKEAAISRRNNPRSLFWN